MNVAAKIEALFIEYPMVLESPGYKMDIITDETGFDALEKDWNKLFLSSNGSIFQSFEWSRTWWKYFGETGKLHILLLRKEGCPIAIFPFFMDEIKIWGFKCCTSLRYIGSNVAQPLVHKLMGLVSYTDYLDAIIKRGSERESYIEIMHYLSEKLQKVDEIIFDEISEHNDFWEYGFPLLGEVSKLMDIEENQSSQIIKLSSNWEGYLNDMSKGRRYKTRQSLNKIIDPDKKIFCVNSPENEDEFSQYYQKMVSIHQRKWNELGSIGTFFEDENRLFHEEVSQLLFKKGWLKIHALSPISMPEEVIAIDLNYCFRNRIYKAHTAVDKQSEYFKEGPGTCLLNMEIKEAFDDHMAEFDFMRGDEEYKRMVSNVELRSKTITLRDPHWYRNKLRTLVKRKTSLSRSLNRKISGHKLKMENK
jgi:CelD/BcsL family acetyltransferase involved in cellulose biosynthesis